MGFSYDPGALPFVTVRRQQWECRLAPGDVIEVHGEHGCTLPAQPAIVVSITPWLEPCPGHLMKAYFGLPLVAVSLAPANLQA